MTKLRNPHFLCSLASMALFGLCVALIQANVFGLKSVGRSLSLDTYTKTNPLQKSEDLLEDFLFIDIDEKT